MCIRDRVCAVEVDERLKPILDVTVGEFSNLEILWGDVLKQDIPALVKEKFGSLRPRACANLPYYITSPILAALLEAECFRSVTVMVQKEVAQRIAAKPGTPDYGAFTVFCQYYACLLYTSHRAQSVAVGFQEQAVVNIFAAKIGQNAALGGDLRREAQGFKGRLHPFGRPAGKAGGRVDGQQRSGLLPGVVRIIFVNHSFLLAEYSARHQPLPA